MPHSVGREVPATIRPDRHGRDPQNSDLGPEEQDGDVQAVIFGNIIIPRKDITGLPPTRLQFRSDATSQKNPVEKFSQIPTTRPKKLADTNFAPAGPDAIGVLCDLVPPKLLARLSSLSNVEFSISTIVTAMATAIVVTRAQYPTRLQRNVSQH